MLWTVVDISNLEEWGGALLYECDTNGKERGCCIAIQSMDELLLQGIRESLSRSREYQQVADTPMFFENEDLRAQPLMDAGMIDYSGNVTGNTVYCSRPALDAVRSVS